jgi:hypothetical protein
MKNIEKIGIDTMIQQFEEKYTEMIQASISAKAAVEMAQQNFKKTAGPLLGHAKDTAALILEDGVSEDAIKYFEDRISEIVKIPFKVRN